MLSIYKNSSGQTVVNITDCETIREVKVVRMSNLGLTDFDQQMFSQMLNVEEMDISGNLLETIPNYIYLPNLKRLNCSRNKFTDLMFVQHFPKLEELDMTGNAVAFSDFCIASSLCPTLKKISNQEINIKKLNQKMEDQLKPVISKIWSDHFHATYRKSMADSEFAALGDKFRTMLKHASIPGTKLLKKFKDFKLACMIEEFLTMVRNSPIADDLPSTMGGKAKKNYTWKKSLDESRTIQSAKTTDSAAVSTAELGSYAVLRPLDTDSGSKLQEGDVIIETVESPAQVDSSSVIVVPDSHNTLEVGSDTIIVFTDEATQQCSSPSVIYVTKEAIAAKDGTLYREVYVENNGSHLTVDGQSKDDAKNEVVEQSGEGMLDNVDKSDTNLSKQVNSPPLEETVPDPKQPDIKSQSPQCDSELKTKETENAKNEVAETTTKVGSENEEKQENVGNDASNSECTSQDKKTVAETGERKMVKFWLYDEEIKPLRRKKPKPPTTRGRRRGNLTKYIVGPASEHSLASKRNANAADQTQSYELPTPASIARSLYNNTSRTLANSSQSISTSHTNEDLTVSQDNVSEAETTTFATLMAVEPTNGCLALGSEQIDVDNASGKVTILNLDSYSQQTLSPVSETGQFDACIQSQSVMIEVPTETGQRDIIQVITLAEHDYDFDSRRAAPPKKRVRFLDEVEQELKASEDSLSNDDASAKMPNSFPENRLDGRNQVEEKQQSKCQT